ncbi:unnamed protein product [Microthlaspi erraticum]|uniref:Uncharacterized protein n=1 Tax=Microthlaspi erraticum TaxID=1685480 RepID=A0A6D2JTQ6_9BRAS|nr:unnamed protein product [Microthlaspi erraticum]CAA7059756.1 unnamed protein product [Microthlaspi erraticum]
MATFEQVYHVPVNPMESRKRKAGVPLPYLIRPRRKLPVYDTFNLYNDYLGTLSTTDGFDYVGDDDDSTVVVEPVVVVEAVETSSTLDKVTQNDLTASLSELDIHALDKGIQNDLSASLSEMDINFLPLEKGIQNDLSASLSGMGISSGHSLKCESDDEYVVVEKVEALPNSKIERVGAIQMLELSKDAADEPESKVAVDEPESKVAVEKSESKDAGSNSDDEWVVV